MRPKRGRPRKGTTVDTDLVDVFVMWNRAVASKIGIGIESKQPHNLAMRLYAARRDSNIAAYDDFRIVELADEVRIIRCM